MPIYKVKAQDGNTLEIEADDESALDEAMSEYEAKPAPTTAPDIQASAPMTRTPEPMEQRMTATAGGDVLGRQSEQQTKAGELGWNVLSGITPIGSAHGLMTEGMDFDIPTALRVADVGLSAVPMYKAAKGAMGPLKGSLGAGLAATGAVEGLNAAGVDNPYINTGAALAAGIVGGGAAEKGIKGLPFMKSGKFEAPKLPPWLGGAAQEAPLKPSTAVSIGGAASMPQSPLVPRPMGRPMSTAEAVPELGQDIEKSWLGGKGLTPGQRQQLSPELKGVDTATKDLEFRLAKTGAGVADSATKLDQIHLRLKELAEKQAQGGSNIAAGTAGNAIAENYRELLKGAGAGIEQAEEAVKALPGFKKLTFKFGDGFRNRIKAIGEEYKLGRNQLSPLEDDAKNFFGKVIERSKRIGNIDDLITFRRWLRNETKASKAALQSGSGGWQDVLEESLYKASSDTLGSVRVSAAERQALDAFMDASEKYAKTKFSPEAKYLKDAIGYKGTDLPLNKTGEQISKDLFQGGRNLGEKISKASEMGLVKNEDIKRAAWGELFERVTSNEGKLDRAALRRTVDSMDDTAKQFLFGADAGQVAKAADVADLVTYAQRYAPQTGFSLPKLVEMGGKFTGPIGEGAKSVASTMYFKSAPALGKVKGPKVKMPGVSPAIAPTLRQSMIERDNRRK